MSSAMSSAIGSPNGHGTSGLLPPFSVVASWPRPNYEDPVTRSRATLVISILLGTVMLVVVAMRLWARIVIQRNAGLDDWLIIVAMLPVIALTVIVCLATEVYNINRHIWDVPANFFIPERKFTFAIYLLYVISGGLLKTSILLFYRRLDNRCVTRSFRLATWFNIFAIVIFILSFTLILVTACSPIEAFWVQFDLIKQMQGYTYTCWIDEGAYILSASVVSSIQDAVTAFLPTLLYWNLNIARRQKIALGALFALGYVICIIAGIRSYYIWHIFNDPKYDSTWLSWPVLLLTVIEVQLGLICASAPALKVFCCHYLRVAGEKSGGNTSRESDHGWAKASAASAPNGSREAIVGDLSTRYTVDEEDSIALRDTKVVGVASRTEHMETFVYS